MAPTLEQLPRGPLGATEPVALAEPPQVPGYELREPLGRGGMGVVYRARELSTARDVALKWLGADAPEVLRLRFEREARTAAAVRHPHIVPILSAGSSAKGSWIVMELVEGFSLHAALAARALGRNALADLTAKLARALDAAHRSGVVHRDVKPANVVVDEKGEPRLIDFGLARFLSNEGQLTAPNSTLGTPDYMAPEVVGGGGAEAGPACDIYALGAILYEGLSGVPPYGAGETREVLARIAAGKIPPLPADTPRALAEACVAALERDPAKRPTAVELAERLEAFLAPPVRPRPRIGTFVAVGALGALVARSRSRALRAGPSRPTSGTPPKRERPSATCDCPRFRLRRGLPLRSRAARLPWTSRPCGPRRSPPSLATTAGGPTPSPGARSRRAPRTTRSASRAST